MSDAFRPSETQAAAIAQVVDWFENRTKDQQVFRVFGYAGTGKTTITRSAIAELGLDGGVLYAAFTGKAALVMTRKGTPAQTIHSLIYRVSEATPEEIEKAREELAKLRERVGALSGTERLLEEGRLASLELRIKDMHRPRFVLNDQSAMRDAKLIVLDEVSMVGDDMARDLLSFGRPILVLGDPGQLPPIKGEGAFTLATPDVMLTEIHRQAAESAVVRLATWAREGTAIPYGEHDPHVWKLPRFGVGPEQMLRGGQVIVGRNATRFQLNMSMKGAAGFHAPYPEGRGEKIICLKNRNDVGIVNGMFVTLDAVEHVDERLFRASLANEDGQPVGPKRADGSVGKLTVYKGHFDDHVRFDKDRGERDFKVRKGTVEAAWGWAITCHKAQGSQWENVIVWDDGLGRTPQDRARWLYTAITRAERGLVLLD